MKQRFIKICVCLYWVVAAQVCFAEQALLQPLKVWGNEHLPPMCYLVDGKPVGFGVEITRVVLEKAQIDYEINVAPWARAYEEAKSGNGIVFGMYWTLERAQIFDYTLPLWKEDIVLVTKKDKTFPFSTIEDLAGKKIAFQKGTRPGSGFIRALKTQLFEGDPDNYPPDRLRKILVGRVDAGIFNPGKAALVWNARQSKLSADDFSVLDPPLATKEKHIGILKSNSSPELIARINAAIKQLMEDGTLERIKAAYQ